MNQTNIESLFQVIAPGGDRTSSAARTSGDTAGFDDHLSQASASVFDVVRPPSSDTASSYSTSTDSRSLNGSNFTSADSTSSHNDGAGSTVCPPAPPRSSVESADDKNTAADDIDGDEHDTDKSNEEASNAPAGAAQTAGTNAPQRPEAKSHTSERDVAPQSKDGVATDETAKQHPICAAAADDASAKSDAQAGLAHAALIAAEDRVEETSDKSENFAGNVEQSNQDKATTKQTKKGERAGAANAGADADWAAHAKKLGEQSSTAADGPDAAANTPEQSTAHTQANAAAEVATPTSSADSDSSSDEEPQHGSKTSARANSLNDAATSAAKAAATAIANGMAANIAGATANGDATNDASDTSTKPVAAKSDTAVGPLGRATRATVDIGRGPRSSNANETPRVDPARFVGRVAKAFQTANERGGTLQLRLSPPELGALKIQLTVKDGVLSAALETDNAGARRVLLDHLPMLRDRLAEQNIRVDRFDVDVRQENNGGQANPRGAHQQPHQQQPEQTESRRAAGAQQRAAELVLPESPAVAPQITSTGINLFV